jgi:hypothetical protein
MALPVFTEPVAFTIPDFCRTFGVDRTTAYRLIEIGQIITLEIGRRTVIDAASAARWYQSLPVRGRSVSHYSANKDTWTLTPVTRPSNQIPACARSVHV